MLDKTYTSWGAGGLQAEGLPKAEAIPPLPFALEARPEKTPWFLTETGRAWKESEEGLRYLSSDEWKTLCLCYYILNMETSASRDSFFASWQSRNGVESTKKLRSLYLSVRSWWIKVNAQSQQAP